jgi:hypothetical protein
VLLHTLAELQLPAGWDYSRTDERLTTVAPDGGALISFAVTQRDSKEALWSAIYGLLAEQEITGVVDQAVDLDQPMARWPAGSLEVQAWQIEKPKRGQTKQKEDPRRHDQPGALLLGVTRMGNGQAVVGIGFLLRSAPTAHAATIKDAMITMRAVADPGDRRL